jgi:hypothetical protein
MKPYGAQLPGNSLTPGGECSKDSFLLVDTELRSAFIQCKELHFATSFEILPGFNMKAFIQIHPIGCSSGILQNSNDQSKESLMNDESIMPLESICPKSSVRSGSRILRNKINQKVGSLIMSQV